MMRSWKYLLVAVVCVLYLPSAAQVTQPQRYESEFKYSEGTYSVLSMKEEGLFAIRDREKYESGKKLWQIIMLDTALNERKSIDLHVDQRMRLVGYEYMKGRMMLLFRQGDTSKGILEVHQISIHTDERPRYTIEPELTFSLTHFTQLEESVILGGYINKDPAVLLYDLKEEKIKVLPGFFQKDTELVDLRVNQNSTFNVVLIERMQRDRQKLAFRTYDAQGNMLLEDEVTMDPDITLQNGITSTLEREDLMILGTWGQRNSKQSNGFYALPVDPYSEQKIQYVAFGQLDHYLDYIKPNRAQRIKEKSKAEMEAGGIPNYLNYVMPYRIQETKNGYIVLAEVYNPSSTANSFSNPYSPYNPYYNPYGYYYPGMGRYYSPFYSPYNYGPQRVPNEIKTVATSVVAVSPKGEVLWDVSTVLDDSKKNTMDQVSDFYYSNGIINIIYKEESELNVKRIVLDSKEESLLTEKVRTKESLDEIRSEREYEGGVRYWYDNAFYVWGYQTIRNQTKEEKTRDVFYINKIHVR